MMQGGCFRKLERNLKDVGLSSRHIAECLQLIRNKDTAALLKILISRRAELLAAVHRNQDMIENLDYLVYCLKNTENITEGGR
jgi:hypothetical protein